MLTAPYAKNESSFFSYIISDCIRSNFIFIQIKSLIIWLWDNINEIKWKRKMWTFRKNHFLHTANPVGIGEHHNATNVSRIIATLWAIHRSLQNCVTSIDCFRHIATTIHRYNNRYIVTYLYRCNDVKCDKKCRGKCIARCINLCHAFL